MEELLVLVLIGLDVHSFLISGVFYSFLFHVSSIIMVIGNTTGDNKK